MRRLLDRVHSRRASGLAAALALLLACNDNKVTTPTPPTDRGAALTVSIAASPTSGRAPLFISFTSDVRGGQAPYSYYWDFGNGGVASVANPRVQYLSGGRFSATLRVTSGDEQVTSAPVSLGIDSDVRASCTADVLEGTAPFTARFAADAQGGTGSFAYRWDFGDGTTSSEVAPLHTYASPGTFRQVLTVTSGGSSGSCSNLVTVYGNFHATCRATKAGDTAVQFHVIPSFCVLNQCSYLWDFGGAGAGSGVNTARPLFTYAAPGTYTARVGVGTSGASGGCGVTVTVP